MYAVGGTPAVMKKVKVSYTEGTDETERLKRVTEILTEGVYSYLKKEGLLREDIERSAQDINNVHVLPHVPRQREGDFYLVRRLRSLIRRIVNMAALCAAAVRSSADIMHAHENSSLWTLAFWVLVLRRPAVWDPHDYFHEPSGTQSSLSRLATRKFLERAIISRRTPILTVSEGMRDKYASLYTDATIQVIRNYSSRRDIDVAEGKSAVDTAARLVARRNQLGEGTIRLVYPGLIKAERFALSLIRRLGSINGISLDIYGEDRSGHATHQSALANTLSDNNIENIHLRGPYTSSSIVSILSQYHFAIFPYKLMRANIDFCLPNKFYQCIEAGLPLITSNMKEMGGIIAHHRLGYVFPSGDNAACAEILENCSVTGDDYLALVHNVLTYQSTELDYGQQRSMLLDTYSAAIERR